MTRTSPSQRSIRRIAFLQEYRNRPESLIELIPEVASKGYHDVAAAGGIGQEQALADLAESAGAHRLGFMVFTGFMKYQQQHLVAHPEQRMVLSTDADVEDQDSLPVKMGCPFNPDFQKRYFDFLEGLGRIPALSECWINDEAVFGMNEQSLACYCHVCQADWKQRHGGDIPRFPFRNHQEKIDFVTWRFERWNDVHGRMKVALNKDHAVRAVWLTSPRPCWDVNPWITGIDFSGVIERIDGINTDPYYTFHLPNVGKGRFQPNEVYLTECSRYVHGYTAADDKVGEICAQGFSHPTFTRPLNARDGWWATVLPAALGIDHVTTYTYLLQRVSSMQRGYEEAFRLDPYLAQTRPVRFIAVVDSLETQAFDPDAPCHGATSWRMSRMLTLGDVARHHGLSYSYLPSAQLGSPTLEEFPVVMLPGVTCLSAKACLALDAYVRSGGVLIATGTTATRDGLGRPVDHAILSDVFGVTACSAVNASCDFEPTDGHVAFADLPWPDDITAGPSWGGSRRPVLGLDDVVAIDASTDTHVLARFVDDGTAHCGHTVGRPALTVRSHGRGTAVFLAGTPSRIFTRGRAAQVVLSFAPRVLSRLIMSLAGAHCPLRAIAFPPRVPLQEVRPLDARWMPTMEFLPSVGESLYLATVPSYFEEPFAFRIEAKPPPGRRCREVRELVADVEMSAARHKDGTVEIDASFISEDFLKVFAFFME